MLDACLASPGSATEQRFWSWPHLVAVGTDFRQALLATVCMQGNEESVGCAAAIRCQECITCTEYSVKTV